MDEPGWRGLADAQEGLLARRQLNELGVDRWRVRNQVAAGRWVERSPTVISTTTGPPSREQLMWLGVLHAGPGALIGDLTAAEIAGLSNWHRDAVTVLVPRAASLQDVEGVRFVRTRRDLSGLRAGTTGRRHALPRVASEPAVLHFAAYDDSPRTAQGVLAAVVQQGLGTPDGLRTWLTVMRPLRRTPLFRRALTDIEGGSQSLAELDAVRLCRDFGLQPPRRQVRRRDRGQRTRFTDCEWHLPSGAVIVLEVDGAFHMDAEQWEDDLARQRGLTSPGRLVVRCTARELRDEPWRVARDLEALGVPSRAFHSAP